MEHVLTFEQALAQRFAHLRTREQLSLEEVAAGAQTLDFDWTRGKVWAIEKLGKAGEGAGTRRLSVSELLALPAIFERALRQRGTKKAFTLHDFLPRVEQVAIGLSVIPGEAPAAILRGSSFNFDRYEAQGRRAERAWSSARETIFDMIAGREVPEKAGGIARAARGAAERSVATKLGVPPELVAIASEQRWSESLTAHRNHLVPAEPDGLSTDHAKAWRNASRGHATREILADEEFLALVRSLSVRYATALDASKDPMRPGGAFDPRYALERPEGRRAT